MTLYQLSTVFHVAALAIILAFSLAIVRRHPSPPFRSWVAALAAVIVSSIGEALEPIVGRGPHLDVIGAPAGMLCAALLVETALRFHERRLPRWAWPAAIALPLAWLGVTAALGAPHPLPVLPSVLAIAFGTFVLGLVMIRLRHRPGHPGAAWFGWPMLFYSLFLLSYPFFTLWGIAWLGFAISSLLLQAVGVGMVVYQLEVTALTLREKNEQLEQFDAMKRSFISTVSHELRTPLTVIQGYSEMLEEDPSGSLTPEQAAHLREVRGATGQLADLVGAIVDAMSLETGTMPLKREAFELAPAIEQAVQPLRAAADRKGLRLTLPAPAEPLRVQADPYGLIKVLHHLVANAIKFTPEGGEVALKLEPEPPCLRVSVTDTGIGITAEALARIFEPFVQADGSLTRAHGGTGLGLSIVQRLVQEMGGSLSVESRPVHGSRFSFTVPLAGAPAMGEPTDAPSR